MKKNLAALFLALVMVLTLAACGGGSGGNSRRRETRRGSGPGFLEKIRRGRRGRFHPSAPGRGRDGPPWRRRS